MKKVFLKIQTLIQTKLIQAKNRFILAFNDAFKTSLGHWKTELIFYHLGIAIQFFVGYLILCIDKTGFKVNCIFSLLAVLSYQFVRRESLQKRLKERWENEVINKSVNRFSTGILVSFLDTLHITTFFFATFIGISNLIFLIDYHFVEKPNTHLFKSWIEVFLYTLQSINLTKTNDLKNINLFLSSLLVINSLIGIAFNAFWTALFMKAFESTLLKFKEKTNP
jgi:hypothetical protein